MNIYLLLLTALSAIPLLVTGYKILALTYFWQIKEYRLDRVFSHLKYHEHYDPKSQLIVLTKFVLFFLTLALYFFPGNRLLLFLPFLIYFLYIYEFDWYLRQTIRHTINRPKIKSLRNAIILFFSSMITLLPYLLLAVWINGLLPSEFKFNSTRLDISAFKNFNETGFSQLVPQNAHGIQIAPLATIVVILTSFLALTVDLVSPLVISFFAIITEPLAFFRRKKLVKKATQLMRNYPNLKTIAITGSYGKSTTKEILYQLIKDHFKTIRTAKNKNTAVGIAQTIINEVTADTQILIAEMGAYKIGEIKDSTGIAHPDIAIVTAVEGQHLSLFGSIDNVFKAKYEIVQGAKDTATIILNGDNEYCLRMAERTDKKTMLYFSLEKQAEIVTGKSPANPNKFASRPAIYAQKIALTSVGLEFTLSIGKDHWQIKTNIPGLHNVYNLLAAITAAMELGIKIETIVKTINQTSFTISYLTIKPGIHQSFLLDDGYNSSMAGFLSALDELDRQKPAGQKLVLTQGISELGKSKQTAYQKLAKKITSVADTLITTDHALARIVNQTSPSFNLVKVNSIFDLDLLISRQLHKSDLVLIEGALPEKILTKLYSHAD